MYLVFYFPLVVINRNRITKIAKTCVCYPHGTLTTSARNDSWLKIYLIKTKTTEQDSSRLCNRRRFRVLEVGSQSRA